MIHRELNLKCFIEYNINLMLKFKKSYKHFKEQRRYLIEAM